MRRREALATVDARQTQQHEAHLRDGGIGQHPLQVGLGHGHDVADAQRQHRQDDQHLLPQARHLDHGLTQQPEQQRECRQLGTGRHEQRGHGGRTVVDVGHPHVERNGPQLEGQASHQEHHAEGQHLRRGHAAVDAAHDLGDVQRASGPVDHRHAVEQEAGGQRAQHEVLHGGLGALRPVAAQADGGIQRQRHQLQAQVQHQQVAARDHHHLAQQREERQRVQVRAPDAPVGHVTA